MKYTTRYMVATVRQSASKHGSACLTVKTIVKLDKDFRREDLGGDLSALWSVGSVTTQAEAIAAVIEAAAYPGGGHDVRRVYPEQVQPATRDDQRDRIERADMILDEAQEALSSTRVHPQPDSWVARQCVNAARAVLNVKSAERPTPIERRQPLIDAFEAMVHKARMIQGEIIASGGMATKSAVEDRLMPLFGIDRAIAHGVLNHIEFHNLKPITLDTMP